MNYAERIIKLTKGEEMTIITLTKKGIALTLAILIIATPLLAQQTMDDYVQGKLDGERDSKGNPLWILAGVGCGVFGVGAAYFIKPSPPAHALVGKASGYVMGYTEGYQKKSRNKNAGYACAGWAAWIIFYLATYEAPGE